MPSKLITFDQLTVTIDASAQLTPTEEKRVRRMVRDMPETLRGFVDMNVVPRDLQNKVRITIE